MRVKILLMLGTAVHVYEENLHCFVVVVVFSFILKYVDFVKGT